MGNIPNVLLITQQLTNQYNPKKMPYDFLLYTIEKSVFKAYNVL